MGRAKSRNKKRDHPLRSTDLTFMVVKGTGKVRRFKISSRLLWFAVFFFSAYIVITLFVVNDYLEMRFVVKQQTNQIRFMKSELSNLSKKLFEARQRLALLENPTPEIPVEADKTSEVVKSEQVLSEVRGEVEKPGKTQTEHVPPKKEKTEQIPLVDIKDVRVRLSAASLDVSFKVVNMRRSSNPLRGYVHIIWVDNGSDPVKAWSYPRIVIQNGLPTNYRTGRLFSIRRFKEIQGSFEWTRHKKVPDTLRLVAYNHSGRLIFQKDYKVEQFLPRLNKPADEPSQKERFRDGALKRQLSLANAPYC